MELQKSSETRTALVPVTEGTAHRIGKRFVRGHGFQSASIATLLAFVIIAPVTIGVGLLVFHVLAHGSIGTLERSFGRWFVGHRTKGWNHWTYLATYVGDSIAVIIIAAVVTVLLLVRRWGRQSLLLLFALIIELSVFLTANYTVRRPRPSIPHVGKTPSTYSFPSGHEAAAVVLYGSIAVIVCIATKRLFPRIVAWVFAAFMVVAIGLSRIYRGDHYLTDVIAGLLVGVAALYAGVFITRVITASALAKGVEGAPAIESHRSIEKESS